MWIHGLGEMNFPILRFSGNRPALFTISPNLLGETHISHCVSSPGTHFAEYIISNQLVSQASDFTVQEDRVTESALVFWEVVAIVLQSVCCVPSREGGLFYREMCAPEGRVEYLHHTALEPHSCHMVPSLEDVVPPS